MSGDTIHIIIQTLEKQLSERLEKLWKVFNWSASILIGISGGIIVLGKKGEFSLDNKEFFILSLIIIILTIYAYLWINENLRFERKIREQLEKIFVEEINYDFIKDLRRDKAKFGYKVVIVLLGTVALLAVWGERTLTS
jgi:hypothetical protein